jgi:glycosyltransferase involved in cell wall biosynthesis
VLARRPDAQLTLAGRRAELLQVRAAGSTNVNVIPNFRDTTSVYATSNVAVVPLHSGAGTKLKLLEALAYGRRVVSTPVGMQGLEGLEPNVKLASSADDFAGCIIGELAKGDLSAFEVADRRSAVYTRFSWAKSQQAFGEELSALQHST